MEHFLVCHEHAFATMNGVVDKIMVDNLESAVLQRLAGEAAVFNARYLDFARHFGFEIVACNVGKGNEKGRVENGIGYVKKNFLNGLELSDFSAINPAARIWLDTVANVRLHGETHLRPLEVFEQERAHLKPLTALPYPRAQENRFVRRHAALPLNLVWARGPDFSMLWRAPATAIRRPARCPRRPRAPGAGLPAPPRY